MTGRCRGADAVVQSLIYLQSMEMRVRLTRCRSYVVLVRRAKQPSLLAFSDAALAGVCSPRTASPLAASCWRQRRSQHGIPPPHFPGQRVPLPCTQQSADTAVFSIHSLRPESPGVHSSLLDPRRCARTTSNSSRLLATVALTPPSTSPHLPVAIHSRRLRLHPFSPTYTLISRRAVAIALASRQPASGPTSIRFNCICPSHLLCSELLRSHHHSLNPFRPKPPTRPTT
jgi:hypothetical protein